MQVYDLHSYMIEFMGGSPGGDDSESFAKQIMAMSAHTGRKSFNISEIM